MQNTFFRENIDEVIPNLSQAYNKIGNKYIKNMPNSENRGSSDVYTNHEDFFKYDMNWYQNRLGRGGQGLIGI
jgi:hypothetical protein